MEKSELQDAARRVTEKLFKHCVFLTFEYVALDSVGGDAGPPQLYTASGFVVEMRDQWYLITAGHVFKDDMDANISKKRIRLIRAGLIDYLGPGNPRQVPVIVDYDKMPRMFIDDSKLGVDFGVVELGHYCRSHLEKNKVQPLSPHMWATGKEEFDTHLMFGAPRDLYEPMENTADGRKSMMNVVTVPLRPLERCQIDDPPDTTYPWLFFQVKAAKQISDIAGMSGGPILGLKAEEAGLRYWLVGLQSRWRRESRTAFVCPTRIFMPLIEWHIRNRGPLTPPAENS